VAGKVFLFCDGREVSSGGNPVCGTQPCAGRLVEKPERYPWSSAAAHVKGVDEALVKVAPLLGRVNEWQSLPQSGMTEQEAVLIGRHERTGRPLGEEGFVSRLESRLGRVLHPLKLGRRRKKIGMMSPEF
jgi:putative transposase